MPGLALLRLPVLRLPLLPPRPPSATVTLRLSSCDALSAATLTKFEMSAPEKPGVARARVSMLTLSSTGTGLT